MLFRKKVLFDVLGSVNGQNITKETNQVEMGKLNREATPGPDLRLQEILCTCRKFLTLLSIEQERTN